MTTLNDSALYFFLGSRLSMTMSPGRSTRYFEINSQTIAEIHQSNGEHSTLLAIDGQGSVLHSTSLQGSRNISYTAFGYAPPAIAHDVTLGFNGEPRGLLSNCYLLGNGHRTFSTILRRFFSADRMSPFGKGGLNAYAYCAGDPVNFTDPSGRVSVPRYISMQQKVPFGRNVIPAQRYQKNPAPPAPVKLRNHAPQYFREELQQVNLISERSGEPRRLVTSAKDLAGATPGLEQKFVMNRRGQMAVAHSGEHGSTNYISHATLTEFLDDKHIVSAGTFFVGSLGEATLYNKSGHYRPTPKDLAPAAQKIRHMGLDVTTVPFEF
jgi:RHS repeat-associated protein